MEALGGSTYTQLVEEAEKEKQLGPNSPEKVKEKEEERKEFMAGIGRRVLPFILVVVALVVVRGLFRILQLRDELHANESDRPCACSLPKPDTHGDTIETTIDGQMSTIIVDAPICERADTRPPYWMLPFLFSVKKFINSMVMGDDFLKPRPADAQNCCELTLSAFKWCGGGIIKTVAKSLLIIVATNTFFRDVNDVRAAAAVHGWWEATWQCFPMTWALSANVAAMLAAYSSFVMADHQTKSDDGPIMTMLKQIASLPEILVAVYTGLLTFFYGMPLLVIGVFTLLPPFVYVLWLSLCLAWNLAVIAVTVIVSILFTLIWGLGVKIIWTGLQKFVFLLITCVTLGQWRGCTGHCCHITDDETARDACEWDDFWAYWKEGWAVRLDMPTVEFDDVTEFYTLLYIVFCVIIGAVGCGIITDFYDLSHRSAPRVLFYRISWIAVVTIPCLFQYYVPVGARMLMGQGINDSLDNAYESRSTLSYMSYTASMLDSAAVCALSGAQECLQDVNARVSTYLQTLLNLFWTWI